MARDFPLLEILQTRSPVLWQSRFFSLGIKEKWYWRGGEVMHE
jgi:hypothetical protein